MKNWIGTYVDEDGTPSTHEVQAPDFSAALDGFAALGVTGVLDSFAVEADDVIASAAAKLVDLGLTPDEAAAVVGDPVSGN